MPYPLPLTRTEAYLAYKAGVIQQSDLKPSLSVPRNGIDAWLAYWTGLAADYPKREDGTPHILQEEEAYIAYLCGVINEYPEKCLRRVGAYLRYIISARWGRPDHPLNREELYLSLIETQHVVPSGDPSMDIVLQNTAKADFQMLEMYGNTSQAEYSGKNIIDVDGLGTNTDLGITGEPIGDGILWIHGKATGSGNAKVIPLTNHNNQIPAGTYTATIKYLGGAYSGTGYYLHINQLNGQTSKNFTDGDTQTTVENSMNYDFRVQVSTGQDCDFKVKIMLESGETQTAYEPYTGKKASPSPDYPQKIKTADGVQNVYVCGKNMFDKNACVIGSLQGDGSVTGVNPGWNTSAYIPVSPNTKYYKGVSGSARFKFFDIDGVPLSGVYDDIPNATNAQIFTTPANAYFIRLTVTTENLGTLQIENGEEATAYEEFVGGSASVKLSSPNMYDASLPAENQYINASGSFTQVNPYVYKNQKVAVYPNTKYAVQVKRTPQAGTNNCVRFCQYDCNGNFLKRDLVTTDTIITTEATCQIVWFSVDISNVYDVMITQGDTFLDYEPFYDYSLSQVDGKQDKIYKDSDGVWKKHKELNRFKMLNLPATWDATIPRIYITTVALDAAGIFPIFPEDSNSDPIALTDRFIAKSFTSVYTQKKGGFAMSTSGKNMQFSDLGWTTRDEAYSDVVGTEIMYALVEPEEQVLPDYIVNRIEGIIKMGSENGTTVLTARALPDSVPALLKVEAAEYV